MVLAEHHKTPEAWQRHSAGVVGCKRTGLREPGGACNKVGFNAVGIRELVFDVGGSDGGKVRQNDPGGVKQRRGLGKPAIVFCDCDPFDVAGSEASVTTEDGYRDGFPDFGSPTGAGGVEKVQPLGYHLQLPSVARVGVHGPCC